MQNDLKKAKIKKAGIIVNVYKHISGDWCNYADCNTKYKTEELEFLN